MQIEIPNNAPVYVRIAASIASHADDFRRGDRAAFDSSARRELSAEQVEELCRAVMVAASPARTAFDCVVRMLGPSPACDDRVWGLCSSCGSLVFRIPGHRHGDGQVDSDEHPVWILAAPDDEELPGKLDGLTSSGIEVRSVDCCCTH